MKHRSKNEELVQMISFLLEKHRDALSTDEIQAFETTIRVLNELEDSDPKDYGKILEPIAINLLKFFTKPEVFYHLIEWLNN